MSGPQSRLWSVVAFVVSACAAAAVVIYRSRGNR